MTCKEIVAGDLENEFEVHEPEEVDDLSADEWIPTAVQLLVEEWVPTAAAKTSGKRGRSAQTTLARKKKQKVSENKKEDKEEIPSNKKIGSKPKSPATVATSASGQGSEARGNIKEDFERGSYVVLKTDMIDKTQDPIIWKIVGKLLQKYIPFKRNGKVLYSKTMVYSGWSSETKEQYYSAPVAFIRYTPTLRIIEFYKNKVEIDPKVEEAAKNNFN